MDIHAYKLSQQNKAAKLATLNLSQQNISKNLLQFLLLISKFTWLSSSQLDENMKQIMNW